MAALVEGAVRPDVNRRRDQSKFARRGVAAIARSEAAGDSIPAETVIAKPNAKVAAAIERQNEAAPVECQISGIPDSFQPRGR